LCYFGVQRIAHDQPDTPRGFRLVGQSSLNFLKRVRTPHLPSGALIGNVSTEVSLVRPGGRDLQGKDARRGATFGIFLLPFNPPPRSTIAPRHIVRVSDRAVPGPAAHLIEPLSSSSLASCPLARPLLPSPWDSVGATPASDPAEGRTRRQRSANKKRRASLHRREEAGRNIVAALPARRKVGSTCLIRWQGRELGSQQARDRISTCQKSNFHECQLLS